MEQETPNDQPRAHRFVGRNIAALSLTQAIIGSTQAIVMSVGALGALTLTPNKALATLPTTAMIVALALTAFPATYLIHRLGRRNGFVVGAVAALIAGLVAGYGLASGSFLLFSAGLALVGVSAAFGQQYRFAIADSVPETLKSRAISFVLLGGVVAGFLGPRLAFEARDWLASAQFAGSFLLISLLGAAAIAVLMFTRLAPTVKPGTHAQPGRSMIQLLRTRDILVPILTGMASYAMMTFVMVAAPLAMVAGKGYSVEAATTVIQWHIVAMFVPSFFTGFIIGRFGAHLVAGLGLFLILIASVISLNGASELHFYAALIVLGVGWNFSFIGATTLLTSAYGELEAARVQGLNEQLVFGSMALASIGSGVLLQMIGWRAVNFLLLPVVGAAIILLVWGHSRQHRQNKRAWQR